MFKEIKEKIYSGQIVDCNSIERVLMNALQAASWGKAKAEQEKYLDHLSMELVEILMMSGYDNEFKGKQITEIWQAVTMARNGIWVSRGEN